MADTLKKRIPGLANVSLTPSSGGAFEISVDGKLVFSKLKLGRFPDADEAMKLVQSGA